jgi:hypothetical protein
MLQPFVGLLKYSIEYKAFSRLLPLFAGYVPEIILKGSSDTVSLG